MSRWSDAESGYADSAYYQEDRGDSSPKSEAGVVFRPAFGYHLWVDRAGENGPVVPSQFGGKFVSNGFILELIFNSADYQLVSAEKIDTMGEREPMDVTAFPAVQVRFGAGERDVFKKGDVWRYEIEAIEFEEDVSHLRWV